MWHLLKQVVGKLKMYLVSSVMMLKILLRRRMTMVDMYVALIIAGRRTLDIVPITFREAVGKDLESLGLDGYGKPIENAE